MQVTNFSRASAIFGDAVHLTQPAGSEAGAPPTETQEFGCHEATAVGSCMLDGLTSNLMYMST